MDTDLRRFDLRLFRSRHRRHQLVGAFVLMGVLGLDRPLVVGPDGSPVAQLIEVVFGLCFGLAFRLQRCGARRSADQLGAAIAHGLRELPQVIDSPRQLVVRGLIDNTVMLMLGFMLASTFVFGLGQFGLTLGPAFGLAFGLALGLASGVARSPWPRYLVTCVLLGYQQRLPWRLARFLGWAYQAGMVRLAGVAVQFRHREFQAWLATEHPADEPPPRWGRVAGAANETW